MLRRLFLRPHERHHRPAPSLQLRHLATGLGAIIVGGVLLMAIFAPILAPHDPFAQDLMARLTPPEWMAGGSAVHPFGTDQLGRDYLSRLIYGARISMLIGTLTVVDVRA